MEIDILKYILDNHGAALTADLLFNLCNTSTLTELLCNDERFVTCLVNGTPKVVVRSAVTLCWRKGCEGCGGLHLCKGFFFTGSCQFSLTRRGCIFSHDLHSEYNEKILKNFELETLSRTQLCVLLLQSNNNLLPPICYNYNNRSGCQDSCQRLHICQKFLSQDCSCFRTHDFLAPQPLKTLQDRRIPDSLINSLKSAYANKEALRFADRSDKRRNKRDSSNDLNGQQSVFCDFEHDRSQGTPNTVTGVQGRRGEFRGRGNNKSQPTSSRGETGSLSFVNSNLMLGEGFETSNSNSLTPSKNSQNDLLTATKEVSITSPKHSTEKRQSQGQRDKTEICMYFIKGHCKHEDRCFKAHDKMPYRWELKQDGQWTHMAENEKIEQAYCDPANAYSTTSPLVYFDIMKCEEKEVRRLSTINSVLEPDFIHTTDWLWFWEDEHGKWQQYGAHTSPHVIASITSKQLEEIYLQNNKDVVHFKAGSQLYQLSFQDMIQTNTKYGTKRIVRRRPRFVSAIEVQTKRKRPTNPTTFPEYWDKTQILPTGHKCISLQSSLSEYKEIHDLFCQTMKGFDILKIERIQNKAVWEAFQLHKTQLKDKNNGQQVTEKKLFHGTNPSLVDTICSTNFDWRVNGVNGTVYGQGSYFARDAKYSHSYTGTSDVRFMFVSRVLVGEYTKGRPEYRRPPSKDGGNVNLYDSCVDDVTNPSIFVVFEKQQIYPEYVLQYSERSRRTVFSQPAASTAVMSAPVALSTSSASSVSANALITNPSSSNALRSNVATSSSASSPNAFTSPLATKSTAFSSNTTVTNSTVTLSSSSSAFASNSTPAPTGLSNLPQKYPNQASFITSANRFPTNSTTASSVRSSNAYGTNSHTYTSDSSFRFTASTLQTTPSPTSATTFSTSSPTKKENKCIIA